jgi:hypothetical protein
MATVVIYIDEAGTPERYAEPLDPASGQTPLFTLAALALPLTDWRKCNRGFFRLNRRFFPDMMGRVDKRDEEVEVKGRDLTSPRQKTSQRRQEFNRRALGFMDRCGAQAFAATFLKPPDGNHSSRSIYCSALQILVERVSLFVAEHSTYKSAILICDSRMKGANGLDVDVARSHMSYIFGHETGKTFTNIMEAPLFADSRLTVGLQLADILAANLYANYYHYYLRSLAGALDYSHLTTWPLLDQMQFKSSGTIDGFRVFGFRVIDLRKNDHASAAG